MQYERATLGLDSIAAARLVAKAEELGVARMETVYRATAFNKRGEFLWAETAKNRITTAGLNKLLDATIKTGLAAPAWYIGIIGPAVTDAVTTAGSANLTSATAGFQAADSGRNILVRGAGAGGADVITTMTYSSPTAITLGSNAAAGLTSVPILWEARASDTMAAHTPWVESAAYSAPATRPQFNAGAIADGQVDNAGSPAAYTISQNNILIGGLFLCDNSAIGGAAGTLYGMAPFSVSFRQLNDGDVLSVTATLSATSA